MTRYHTFLDDSIPEGLETIRGIQSDGSEFGVGISSEIRVDNLTTLNNVGIGTTSPQYTLDVNGDINFEGFFYQNGDLFVASRWNSGDGNNIYRLDGNVGIGTTILSGCGALEVIGAICATDFNSTSDISLKENIETVSDPLSKVIKLNGVSFDWKETGKGSYGVIAQELEQVFPELVKGNTLKTVNYNGIIAVLIESIKELNQKVEDLTKDVNDLRMSK